MPDLIGKIEALDKSLGDRLTGGSGVDFGALVPQGGGPPQRDWTSLLSGGSASGNWSQLAMAGAAAPGSDWLSKVFGAGGGGGFDWGGVASGRGQAGGFDLSGFAEYANAKGRNDAEAAAELAAKGAIAQPGTKVTESGGGASGGGYDQGADQFEMYRAHIEKYAAANGIDPDALAAMLFIETDGGAGGATAVSPAGARGLGQVMPGTWAGLADPGDDPFNAEHSIKAAAKYFADQYRRFGSYDLAAAAYQGGPGAIVNGQARNDISDGNLTPAQYAARWRANYGAIQQSAPAKPAGGGQAPVNAQGTAFPVQGYRDKVQLHWGEDRGAADLFAPAGTPVAAMRGGKVTHAGYSDIGGYNVTIEGEDGLTYYYAHLQQPPSVRTGQTLNGGQFIGLVGDTGNAKGTGAHLHLGIGYGIQSGSGPRGGSGINFDATTYLEQVLGMQAQR